MKDIIMIRYLCIFAGLLFLSSCSSEVECNFKYDVGDVVVNKLGEKAIIMHQSKHVVPCGYEVKMKNNYRVYWTPEEIEGIDASRVH